MENYSLSWEHGGEDGGGDAFGAFPVRQRAGTETCPQILAAMAAARKVSRTVAYSSRRFREGLLIGEEAESEGSGRHNRGAPPLGRAALLSGGPVALLWSLSGFTSYQKCSAAIRMLSYGMAADIFDEYLRMGESTCLEAMYRFCRAVIAVFGEYYCREPTVEDTRRLLSINESRGFPGMIGSIDCMHWQWKNCPFGWQGAYSGHEEGRTVILEAVISQDLWIWHSFFGMAGSNNDINVLHQSPVFNRLMQGKAPRVSYEINGNAYDKPYYLADGIYPDWATLVKTVRNPNSEKTRRFAKMQEACRKDVERGFGVLQARWAIVRHPARTWSLKTMHEVMTCCVIMHNMIVENERPDGRNENQWDFQGELVAPLPGASSWQDYLHRNVEVTDENVSKQLQTDLIEHQWTLAGHADHA
ncbi:hypothetical protein QYE76_050170 [Lolium multiflorum]|uniref:Uncharacterized protein n=1 Tax=Lolium multiflorum TaxID=4521 RepID=A0AAD8SPG2_LOLMU|nr:hypothetical protein QYE76_050170 [Lolium multiflorum]